MGISHAVRADIREDGFSVFRRAGIPGQIHFNNCSEYWSSRIQYNQNFVNDHEVSYQ